MLIGRAQELGTIIDQATAACDGRMATLVVEGEAGVGTSALLDEATADLRRIGFEVVQEPIGDSAFVDRIEAKALQGPVAVVLDDLQWADAASVALLRELRRELAELPVALVLGMRVTPRPAELAALLSDLTAAGVSTLRLGGLAAGDLEELAGVAVGAAPGARLLEELSRVGGNPALVLELIRVLRAEGHLRFAAGSADLVDAPMTEALRNAVLSPLVRVEPGTTELLGAASVLGPTFDVEVLGALVGAPVGDLELDEALDTGLVEPVRSSGVERYAFRHDLLRTSLYDSLDPDRRSELHLAAAAVLAERSAPAVEVAAHLLEAPRRADDGLIDLVRTTAWSLMRSSAEVSLQLFTFGLDLLPDGDPRRLPLEAGILRPLLASGEFEECAARARLLLPLLDDVELRVEARETIYLAAMRQGAQGRVAADLEALLEAEDLPEVERGRMTAAAAHAHLQMGDMPAAAKLAHRALAIHESVPHHRTLVAANTALAFVSAARGEVREAVALGQEAAEAQRSGEPVSSADLCYGVMLIEADEFERSAQELAIGRAGEQARGEHSVLPAYDWAMTGRDYLAGRWDEALAVAQLGFDQVAVGTGSTEAALLGRALSARILLHRGDTAGAVAHLTLGDADLARGEMVGADVFLWSRAVLLMQQGDLDGAYNVLRLQFGLSTTARFHLSWRSVFPDTVRLSVAADDAAFGEEVVAIAEEGARRARDLASARGCALRCRGLLEDDPELLVRAVAAYRRSPRVPELAGAAADAGHALVAQGRTEEGVRLLTESLALYEDMGAVADAGPVAAALRRLTASERGPRSAAFGWESLTPSEERVVELVAEGLSTAEIAARLYISRDTVKTHVRHIFTKLGMSSRVELAAAAVRRQQSDLSV